MPVTDASDGPREPDFPYEEQIANARLIAAAPDLLAACERVLRAIQWAVTDDRMTPGEQADTLCAAISKATGKNSE